MTVECPACKWCNVCDGIGVDVDTYPRMGAPGCDVPLTCDTCDGTGRLQPCMVCGDRGKVTKAEAAKHMLVEPEPGLLAALDPIIQDNTLKREFHDPLFPALRFKREETKGEP